VDLIKNYLWLVGIALVIFLVMLTTGIVSNMHRPEGSLISNGSFQLAILGLFLVTAGLGYFWYFSQQPGQIVLRLEPETTRAYIYTAIKYQSSGSESVDTVRAPGKLYKKPAGKYSIETLDQDIVYFHTDVVLEPAESETLVIPVVLNAKTLAVDSEPTGAEIWINGLQASKTPYKFEVLSGDTVNLELKMPGYQVYRDTLSLHEDVDLGTVSLQKLYTVWISSRYADVAYRIYDENDKVVFSSYGSRKLQLAQGRYRLSYEIGEGQYETKTFLLNYNSTVMIP
jgi:hypothetical protein